MIYNEIIITKIVNNEYQFRLVALIKTSIFNNDINYSKECLTKSFDDLILFEVSRLS